MNRTRFVAEVSSNHHQDLQRCLRFVDVAADIGCDSVKFQLFRVDELFAPEVLAAKPEVAERKQWELPVEFLPELSCRAHDRGLEFSCTPFYLEAVSQLMPFVDFFKVASYELLWDDLLIRVAESGKPVVLSTGMATMDEIDHAVSVLQTAGCRDLTLLHCVSGYPTPPSQCNLAAIQALQDAFGCHVGWSDHSVEPAVIHRAIHRWGAGMIEFHLDLEGQGEEFDTGHCWLPQGMSQVIRDINTAMETDGSGVKAPVAVELPDRDWRADHKDGLRPLTCIRSSLT